MLALALAPAAGAQVTSAAIVGTITDSSGGALPGVTVTARNVDTGFNRTVPTDEMGAYRLDFLPIGKYTVEMELSGFKTVSRSGIVLNVNDTVKLDVALEVGGLSETITVEGETPVVNTATADISKTVEAKQIESLPIVDRNVYSLLDITPGVQSNNNGVASASVGTSNLTLGFPEQRTLINGGADGGTGSVNYYLDGGINMTALRNTGNILPNPDAIQEFKVQTNSYNVEYRPVRERHHQRHHEVWHEPLPRLGVRVHARRRPERQGMGLDAGAPAAQAEPVRRHAGRPDSRRTGRSSSAATRGCARRRRRS